VSTRFYRLSLNDAFVMFRWAHPLGPLQAQVAPDGSVPFTRRLGMLVDKDHLGFVYSSWRYLVVANDDLVEKWFEEPGVNDVGSDDDTIV
jgi:peroxiredoxin